MATATTIKNQNGEVAYLADARRTAEIRLPFPPSVNSMFKNIPGRGRARTADYDAWRDQAGWELNAQRIAPFTSRVEVKIDLDHSRRGDADNRNKAVLDLLVAHGVIRGDSKKYVKRVSSGWEAVTGCRITIATVE